jgi:hypothetical protein
MPPLNCRYFDSPAGPTLLRVGSEGRHPRTIAGLGFAYCDFVKENPRLEPAPRRQKPADVVKFLSTPASPSR